MSDQHNGTPDAAHGEAHEHEHIHLPPNSIAPFVLALGLAIILLGLIFNIFILGLGIVVLVGGLGLWLVQDVNIFQLDDDWQ